MRRWVLLSLGVGAVTVAYACGGTTDTGDDGGVDSSTDGTTAPDNFNPPPDSGSDVVTTPDTGTGDAGSGDASDASTTPDGGGKPITSWTCGNATVSDCSQCVGHTQTCVYCNNQDASVVSGTCVQFGTGCGNGIPQGFNLCPCPKTDGGASACPEPYQVCLVFGQQQQQGICDTCGAVQNTNGLTCENGGKCDAVDGGCL
jgi:hypothetical protein